jgi:hypothetical protein
MAPNSAVFTIKRNKMNTKKIIGNEQTQLYIGSRYNVIIHGSIFLLDTGQGFRRMTRESSIFSLKKSRISITDPKNSDKKSSFFSQDDTALISYGIEFEFMQKFSATGDEIEYEDFPNTRRVEAAYLVEDLNIILVVTAPEYEYDYEKLRFFILRDQGRSVSESNLAVTRYRDGGTTLYQTREGTLYVPTKLKKDELPHWNTGTEKFEVSVIEYTDTIYNDVLKLNGYA